MSKNNEHLLNNVLSEDFEKMLRPYYLPLKVMCASKYRVKDNFVLSNSKTYCAAAVFLLCFVTYTFVSVSLTTSCTIGSQCPLINYAHNLFAHFISTACVIFQAESAIKLLIQMQGIDRKLNSFGVTNLPRFVRRSWCFVVCVLILFGAAISGIISNINYIPWMLCPVMFLSVIFDLNMLFAIFIVAFLSSRFRSFSDLFIGRIRNSLCVSLENDLQNTVKVIMDICKETLKAFTQSSNLSQYPMLINVLSTFIYSLITVETILNWTKNSKRLEIYTNMSIPYVLAIVWNIKNFVIMVTFSAVCEKLYARLDDVRNKCVDILNLYPEQRVFRKTAKNILRLCDVRFSKMRVCGLFTVDAGLPLRLVGLVATYCIVLLQFAFL